MRIEIAVVTLCGVLSACATSGAPATETETTIIPTSTGAYVRMRDPAENHTTTVALPAAQVWARLPAVYRQLGLGGAVVNEQQRQYGSERVSGTRVGGQPVDTYFRCANAGTMAGAATRWRVQFSITTAVTARGADMSEVTTLISASATPTEGTSTSRILCASLGTLEQAIAQALTRE